MSVKRETVAAQVWTFDKSSNSHQAHMAPCEALTCLLSNPTHVDAAGENVLKLLLAVLCGLLNT
jgi:hypothetical protein